MNLISAGSISLDSTFKKVVKVLEAWSAEDERSNVW
jgi:hypothetical protein